MLTFSVTSLSGVVPRTHFVEAVWDEAAQVFHSSSDVPGLVIETETLEEFRDVALALGPELLRDNGFDGDGRIQLSLPGRLPELIIP